MQQYRAGRNIGNGAILPQVIPGESELVREMFDATVAEDFRKVRGQQAPFQLLISTEKGESPRFLQTLDRSNVPTLRLKLRPGTPSISAPG